MPATPDSSRAPNDALTIPLDQIVWANPARPSTDLPYLPGGIDPETLPYTQSRREIRVTARKHRRIQMAKAAVGLGVLAAIAAAVPAVAGPEPRLAPPGCVSVTVKPGSTAWAIAGANNVDLGTLARLNPQIESLRLIRPGDTLAVSCAPAKIIDAVAIERNGVQRAVDPLAQYRGQTEMCQGRPCYTWEAILVALHDAGARGEQLVTLAAITPGESGRAVDPCDSPTKCDRTMVNNTWTESGGTFQIRSLRADLGTGRTRDLERVRTLDGGAKSAVELWNQSVERGDPGGKPWTCWLQNWHVSYMDQVRETATRIGVL